MRITHTVMVFALSMLLTSPTFAREPLTVIEMIDHIEELLRDCSWETRGLKGGPLGKMLLHKKTMEDVLDGLKTGTPVEPRKLEKALKAHAR
jgi:hypothetical protein